MKKLVFILCSLLGFVSSFCQPVKSDEINIRAENNTSNNQFFVNITRNQENIFIEYKIRTNENKEKRELDSTTIRIRENLSVIKNISPKNDSLVKVLNALDSICVSYTTFRSDTLHIPKKSFPDYNKIIEKLLITPTSALENSKHICLDGTSFTFRFRYNNKIRRIYARCINKNSHPLLEELITQTLQLYRVIKKNDFLDKKSTCGY